MKVVVCINHVPDTETKIRVAADGTGIDRTGVNFMLSPYDEIAVEEGLAHPGQVQGGRDGHQSGTDANKETLRKALAMGADRAVLLKDDDVRDSFATASGLATEIKGLNPDVVLFGRQSIDYDDAQVGNDRCRTSLPPSVAVVVKLDIQEDGSVVCEREIEGGHEIVHTRAPCRVLGPEGAE